MPLHRSPGRIFLLIALLSCCWLAPAIAQPTYTYVDLSAATQLMLSGLNQIRLTHGLGVLQLDPVVARVAEDHARDMVLRNYFAHVSPDGDGPQERLAEAGLPYPVGENLGAIRSYGLDTQEIVQGLLVALMNSPHHRANILDPRATAIGLGFCQDVDNQSAFMDLDLKGHLGAGTVLVSQEFVRKPLKSWSPSTTNESLTRGARLELTGSPVKEYAGVVVQVYDRATQELVNLQHTPIREGSFATALKLSHPGKYEVRVLGLEAGALIQAPEPLGVFLFTVAGSGKSEELADADEAVF